MAVMATALANLSRMKEQLRNSVELWEKSVCFFGRDKKRLSWLT
jgi:hypothetical protein